MKKIPVILLLLISFCTFDLASAQENDAGLWLGGNVEKDLSKNLTASFSGEFRFNENISELESSLFDLGLSYKINKYIKFSANYRFAIKRNSRNEYNNYHRYFFDLAYKKSLKPFTIQFRTRFQSVYSKFNTHEDLFASEFYSRNKITVKYQLKKKIEFYGSVELFSPLWNHENIFRDKVRYILGLEYQINKKQSIDLYYMIQKEYEVKNPLTEYIIGCEYNIKL